MDATPNFLLVHGGAHSKEHWKFLREALDARGHDSIAPQLPSEDPNKTMSDYADIVADAIQDIGASNTILAGHSLNGLMLPLAATRQPVRALVFICAIFPEIGHRFDPAKETVKTTAEVTAAMQFISDDVYIMNPKMAGDVFYNKCTPEISRWAVSELRPQANVAALSEPLEKWPDVPTYVIVGAEDRSIRSEWSHDSSMNMFGVPPIELESDHSPFLSMPDRLAEAMIGIAEGKYPAGSAH